MAVVGARWSLGAGVALGWCVAVPAAAQPAAPPAEEPESATVEADGERDSAPGGGEGEPESATVGAAGAAGSATIGAAGERESAPGTAAGEPDDAQADADKNDDELAFGRTSTGHFAFGSYGRITAASDADGRPAREADIVARGSRLDLPNYVELELRRDDYWHFAEAHTRFVSTLAIGHPVFHYDGEFDAALAVRNLYLEERDLGLEGLSVWAGSRMLRGDDIYLLDWWPLDNLNTVGGGARYGICGTAEAPAAEGATDPPQPASSAEAHPPWCTNVSLHVGLGQPNNPFYQQEVSRPAPLNQFGAATVALLDRQRWVGSLKAEQLVRFGGPAGLKFVAYGEVHQVPSAEREADKAQTYESLPADGGFVVGGQVGAFSGKRDTHVNLFVRYAGGLAAYGEFAMPTGLSLDRTTDGAHELVVAAGGNGEIGPFAITAGGYFRSFRNANDTLDFGDVDEGIAILRPHLFFADWAGVAVEFSYQAQHRGVMTDETDPTEPARSADPRPLTAHLSRLGVMPFLAPAGPGAYSRPWLYLAYMASFRDEGARLLYPVDDAFRLREIDHFIGLGAEWWFGSTSYGEL